MCSSQHMALSISVFGRKFRTKVESDRYTGTRLNKLQRFGDHGRVFSSYGQNGSSQNSLIIITPIFRDSCHGPYHSRVIYNGQ